MNARMIASPRDPRRWRFHRGFSATTAGRRNTFHLHARKSNRDSIRDDRARNCSFASAFRGDTQRRFRERVPRGPSSEVRTERARYRREKTRRSALAGGRSRGRLLPPNQHLSTRPSVDFRTAESHGKREANSCTPAWAAPSIGPGATCIFRCGNHRIRARLTTRSGLRGPFRFEAFASQQAWIVPSSLPRKSGPSDAPIWQHANAPPRPIKVSPFVKKSGPFGSERLRLPGRTALLRLSSSTHGPEPANFGAITSERRALSSTISNREFDASHRPRGRGNRPPISAIERTCERETRGTPTPSTSPTAGRDPRCTAEGVRNRPKSSCELRMRPRGSSGVSTPSRQARARARPTALSHENDIRHPMSQPAGSRSKGASSAPSDGQNARFAATRP